MNARYLWLSHTLSEKTAAYGGGKSISARELKSIEGGDHCNSALWELPNHLGTHVDAPRHFFRDGLPVDLFEPSFWVFESIKVLEVKCGLNDLIGSDSVIPFIKGRPELLLIKTGMGRHIGESLYWSDNPGLSPELGSALRAAFPSIRAVGVDFISVTPWKNRDIGREAHKAFLDPQAGGSPIVLIEDMDLTGIDGQCTVEKVIVLPLRVAGGDGAPCTVMARLVEPHNIKAIG